MALGPGTVGCHAREQAGEETQEGAGSCSPVSTHVSRQGRGQGKTCLPLTQVRGHKLGQLELDSELVLSKSLRGAIKKEGKSGTLSHFW